MSNRKLPFRGQTVMLEADPDTMAERALPAPKEFKEEAVVETVIGGPSVSLVDYYKGQLAILGLFSKVNKGENFRARFSAAAGGSADDLAVLEAQFKPRYGNKLDEAYTESEEAKDRLDKAARDKFAGVLGYESLMAFKLKPRVVVDSLIQRDYREFSKPYYGLPNKEAKNDYIRQLKGKIKGLKERTASGQSYSVTEPVVKTDQPTLWSDQLDVNRGIIIGEIDKIDVAGFDQDLTLTQFIGEQGFGFGASEREQGADVELQVSWEDFANIEPSALRNGLYIGRKDPRYEDDDTEQLLWASGDLPISPLNPKMISKLELEKTGVVMPPDEFKHVAHSPPRLIKFAKAGTRDKAARIADESEEAPDIDEINERAGRSAGHIMESKIEKLESLVDNLGAEIKLFRDVYRAADSEFPQKFKPEEIAALSRLAEGKFHKLIDVATVNLNFGAPEIRAMHRALSSSLHRGSPERDISTNWRIYASLGAQYAYARLVKTIQSKVKCQELLEVYAPFLERAAETNGAVAQKAA